MRSQDIDHPVCRWAQSTDMLLSIALIIYANEEYKKYTATGHRACPAICHDQKPLLWPDGQNATMPRHEHNPTQPTWPSCNTAGVHPRSHLISYHVRLHMLKHNKAV
jgi:hypothetical protein